MSANDADITAMIDRIDTAWSDFHASYDGLTDEQVLIPGVIEAWSVRDILAHVAVWDTYALNMLPGIVESGQHPDYAARGETIDAYNARMTEEKRHLSLAEARRDLDDSHRRLLDYLRGLSPDDVACNEPFRERLAADTWDHYPEHAAAIRTWRERQA